MDTSLSDDYYYTVNGVRSTVALLMRNAWVHQTTLLFAKKSLQSSMQKLGILIKVVDQ